MRRDIYYWRPSHRFEAVLWLAARFASEDRRLCMRRLMASVGAGVPKKRCDPIRFFDHFFRQPDHADLSRQALFVLDCFIRAACSCDAAHQESESASVEVSVYTITAAPLTLTTDLPGRTTAFRAAGVRPQISGIVEHRLFTEGTEVKQGQRLYQIDPRTYQAQQTRARASLRNARNLAERYARLSKTKAISQQQ
ncbi:biotin/lipoyl-binding protein [Pseudomonas sp. PS1(2021)]|uniref:biotin/lipoyl-binding protein n=1 Tax=Pseudomonas sp. PS1(2021) TaxID=2866282 RepID=UPI00298F4CEC|nr:biotin/lipoyl-binding protein [Pseudomonas sp. PS1(2021)]